MRKKIRNTIFFLLSLIFLMMATLFVIKVLAYKNATPSDKYWNKNNLCYFITYVPNYKPYGGVGRVLKLFSNQSFFVVYNKENEKIRSSAWYFWEYQFSDKIEPEWSGIDVLYPSDDGWSGWTLHECK
ncbi:hypothetical protein AB8989_18900 [Yersinia hibernica]|uniref:DUF943 family protein n=1 Tax=Yersinia hibernica TaxID=2339259 RepID=A0ABX5R4A5_9GAMM|nr:hypothetical protein [Yersinia hibernica]QAX80348.1 hypothetical protein D5F51_18505 [Yersinia hibernica]